MSEKNMPAEARTVPVKPPIWKSRTLVLAVVITLVGVGLWAYAAATRPQAPAPAPRAATPDGLVQGFSSGDPLAGSAGGAGAIEKRFIDTASPVVTRFGACFIAGFCVAYAFKKFIKVTALITGVLLIAIFAMRKAGIIDLDWSSLEHSINSSVAWLRGEAGGMKDFITGYLPSAGSAAAGMFVGFRKG